MAYVARVHGGDCGSGPPGGGPPDDGRYWQPPSGCQGSERPKKGRGKTRNKGLKSILEKTESKILNIDFEFNSKNTYAPIGPNKKFFTSVLGTIVGKIPKHYPSWNDIPEADRNLVLQELQSYFNLQPHLTGPNATQIERGIS